MVASKRIRNKSARFRCNDNIKTENLKKYFKDYLCPLYSLASTKYLMFNKRIKIKEVLAMPAGPEEITVMGWVRTLRNNQFIALNDGSSNENLQIVLELGSFDETLLRKITTGTSIRAVGQLVASLGK